MKKRHAVSLFLALLCAAPLSGCEYTDAIGELLSSSSEADDSSSPRYDIGSLKTEIEQMTDCWTYQDKETELQEQIDRLLTALDEAYALKVRAEMAYHADWKNESLQTYRNQTNEDYLVVCDMISWAFTNGYKKSMYVTLFEPYYDKDNEDYFTLNPLSRIISYARADAADSDSLLDDYYDTAYSDDISAAETNLKCAELYLDILKQYDLSEYVYDYYNRDYTAEEISAMYHDIIEQLVPLQTKVSDRLEELKPEYYDSYDKDAYELLEKYAPKLSPPIAESAEKLLSEKLYVKATGENCYDGSYTAALPNEQSAMIYTYLDGTIYDLMTVTHEFGHFHSDWRDTTPVYFQTTNLDIAEAQSQSMELLFLSFYPEILGDSAEYYELIVLYNMLDSVISGFTVGEFEYEVMKQADTVTAEEVVSLFQKINDEAKTERELYQISHLYEQPAYFISYGVSALPALRIYTIMLEDPQRAIELYDKLSSIPNMTSAYTFSEAMEECGLPDFFEPEALDDLLHDLEAHIDSLTE